MPIIFDLLLSSKERDGCWTLLLTTPPPLDTWTTSRIFVLHMLSLSPELQTRPGPPTLASLSCTAPTSCVVTCPATAQRPSQRPVLPDASSLHITLRSVAVSLLPHQLSGSTFPHWNKIPIQPASARGFKQDGVMHATFPLVVSLGAPLHTPPSAVTGGSTWNSPAPRHPATHFLELPWHPAPIPPLSSRQHYHRT